MSCREWRKKSETERSGKDNSSVVLENKFSKTLARIHAKLNNDLRRSNKKETKIRLKLKRGIGIKPSKSLLKEKKNNKNSEKYEMIDSIVKKYLKRGKYGESGGSYLKG